MTSRQHNLGDRVVYMEEEWEVVDKAFASLTLDSEMIWSTAKKGALHYQIMNVKKQHCKWVMADSLDFASDDTLQQVGYDIVSWREGLDVLPDNSNLPSIVTLLMAVQYDKEKHYGSSWKGKGEYRGIMANIDRKYDRLDKMTQEEISGNMESLEGMEWDLREGRLTPDHVGESKIDAIADLTNYGLLYMTWVRDNFPLCFKIWVDKNVPTYLRDRIPFI